MQTSPRNLRIINRCKEGKTLTEIAEEFNISPQRASAILSLHMIDYKGCIRRANYKAAKIIPVEEEMTECQRGKYNTHIAMYNMHIENPDMTLRAIAKHFDCSNCTAGNRLKRVKQHYESGEPFFTKQTRRRRVPREVVNYDALNPRVKNPDDMWAAAAAKGLMPARTYHVAR